VLFSEPKIPQSSVGTGVSIDVEVSVLFSEPKIPQSEPMRSAPLLQFPVSVLFSEPKIPQLMRRAARRCVWRRFQCSSASRKFLN